MHWTLHDLSWHALRSIHDLPWHVLNSIRDLQWYVLSSIYDLQWYVLSSIYELQWYVLSSIYALQWYVLSSIYGLQWYVLSSMVLTLTILYLWHHSIQSWLQISHTTQCLYIIQTSNGKMLFSSLESFSIDRVPMTHYSLCWFTHHYTLLWFVDLLFNTRQILPLVRTFRVLTLDVTTI